MDAAPETAAADLLPWMAGLRPDERERASHHFRRVDLAGGGRLALPADGPPTLGVVLEGKVTLRRPELPGLPPVESALGAGDRWGELALFAGLHNGVEALAPGGARIALLDAAAFEAIAKEFPVVWLEVAKRLSREMKWKNDLLREIQEIDVSAVDPGTLDLLLASKRRRVARRGAGVARRAGRAFYRRMVADPGREPAFWILSGFVLAILLSRLVVAAILRFHLEHTLFALRDSGMGGNPLHTHHFNYGFALIVASGLLTFVPRVREWLKPLAFVFGFGLGLVFDEFALIWNLNPDYYQSLSYEAQAALALVLIQVVWFRRFYVDLWDRLARGKGET